MGSYNYTISIDRLGEQLTLNQWVLGSSPRWCTKKRLAEKQGAFLMHDIAEMSNPVHQRGREQHVRPASVLAGSLKSVRVAGYLHRIWAEMPPFGCMRAVCAGEKRSTVSGWEFFVRKHVNKPDAV